MAICLSDLRSADLSVSDSGPKQFFLRFITIILSSSLVNSSIFKRFNHTFRSNRGIYYNIKLIHFILLFFRIGAFRPVVATGCATKCLFMAYLVVMNIDRHRWAARLWCYRGSFHLVGLSSLATSIALPAVRTLSALA